MTDSPRPFHYLRLAVWFGLVAGVVEAALLGVKKFYLGQIVRVDYDIVWMSPLADVVWFLGPAAVLAALSWWRPSRRLFLATVFLLTFLTCLSWLLLYHPIEMYAKTLVAAGLAVQTTRLLSKRTAGFQLAVRRTLPLTAGLIVIVAVGVHVWRWIDYRQTVAALPRNAARAPNVLLIVLDTVRARSMSVYGYERATTPNLDRLAKGAAVFERAIAPSPWTFPSHATMFTGRWPHELSADWHTPLNDQYPTLAEVLRDRGYLTAGFAANTFYCTSEFGMNRGFLHYEDYSASASQILISSSLGRLLLSFSLNHDFTFHIRDWIGYVQIPGRKTAEEINDGFLGWLSRQDTERPFFAFLNYLEAHQPFLPPSPFDVRFRGTAPRGDPRHWWDRQWSRQDIQAETDAYDGAIAYMDHQIGLLLEELRRRGKLDETVVIVTSDHGEHLGEHGFMRHGHTLYLEVLHVPLMVAFPAKTARAVTVREPVSLRDIPATVLAMIDPKCHECFPGRSLTRYWTDDGVASAEPPASPMFAEVSQGIRIPDRYPNAKGDMKSLIADDMHYIVSGDGTEELYNLLADPRETRNLARSSDAAAALEQLRRGIHAVIPARRGSRAAVQPPPGR